MVSNDEKSKFMHFALILLAMLDCQRFYVIVDE